MKVLITDSAFADLDNIIAYYREQKVPQIGEALALQILEKIEILPQQPKAGRIVPEYQTENIRELIEKPYRIVYLLKSESIHIIRVWRSERLMALPDSSETNSENSSENS